VLHNPRYAGAFAYGQRRFHKKPDGGETSQKLPREQWFSLHRDAHPGYMSVIAKIEGGRISKIAGRGASWSAARAWAARPVEPGTVASN